MKTNPSDAELCERVTQVLNSSYSDKYPSFLHISPHKGQITRPIMTTKKFSALTLPQPRYFCQIGCCDVTSNLAKWLPPFTDMIQIIEVRRTGCTAESVLKPQANLVEPLLTSTSGAGVVIENARPELFLRRDFISSFVDQGSVYMWPMWPSDSGGGQADHQYQISCRQSVLSILLNEKQYRRFGLLAKKVTSSAGGCSSSRRHSKRAAPGKQYRIDIDLKENQIKESNKYQERLVTTLRRLSPVNKLYFRFAPYSSEPATTTAGSGGAPAGAGGAAAATSSCSHQQETADKCIEFFRFVMREYAEDGLRPVPLTGCSKVSMKLDRSWTNYSQRCAPLGPALCELQRATSNDSSSSILTTMPPVHRNVELLNEVLDLVNWLGYQVLSLDTGKLQSASSESGCDVGGGGEGGGVDDRGQVLDVSCSQVSGLVDSERLAASLGAVLTDKHLASDHQDYIELRALILYERGPVAPSPSVEAGYDGQSNAGVVLLQDCSSADRHTSANLLTALNMSSLP